MFSSTTVQKHPFFGTQSSLWSNSHNTTGKTIAFTIWTFVSKVMSLLLNTMCRCVIAFLPRSKRLLISWLQSPSPQFWSPRKYSLSLFPVFPHQYMQSLCVWVCSLWFLPTLKHGSLFPDAQWYVCVCVCVCVNSTLGNILVEIIWGPGLKYIPPKTMCPGTKWYYISGTT